MPYGYYKNIVLNNIKPKLLLLLLSRFGCVRLCAPIDGIPPGSTVPGILQVRTLEWVAISFSNAWKWKVKSESEVVQSCPTPSDPMDHSLPGSSLHGIFQTRVLEWDAIAFFDLVSLGWLKITSHVWNYILFHRWKSFYSVSFDCPNHWTVFGGIHQFLFKLIKHSLRFIRDEWS